MTNPGPNEVVRLVTAPNPASAHILRQALEENGIMCRSSATT